MLFNEEHAMSIPHLLVLSDGVHVDKRLDVLETSVVVASVVRDHGPGKYHLGGLRVEHAAENGVRNNEE